MKKAIIFGTGIFAETISFYLDNENDIQICGYTVDSKFRGSNEYMGLPFVDFESAEDVFPPEEYGIYICVGYTNMNIVRERIFRTAQSKGYEILSYFHPSAVINSKVIGQGNIILDNVTFGPFSEIGSGNIFYPNTNIAHHVTIGNFNYFSAAVSVAGCCCIGSNSFFGINSTIKDRISVADKTFIGAACYINRNTAPGEVYAASFAKRLDKFDSMQISRFI